MPELHPILETTIGKYTLPAASYNLDPTRVEPEREETPHVPHSPQTSTARAESERDETLHVPPKPQPSPARPEQGHDEMTQTFQQASLTHEE